jgi:Fe2+ transport system protein B
LHKIRENVTFSIFGKDIDFGTKSAFLFYDYLMKNNLFEKYKVPCLVSIFKAVDVAYRGFIGIDPEKARAYLVYVDEEMKKLNYTEDEIIEILEKYAYKKYLKIYELVRKKNIYDFFPAKTQQKIISIKKNQKIRALHKVIAKQEKRIEKLTKSNESNKKELAKIKSSRLYKIGRILSSPFRKSQENKKSLLS